MKKILSCFLIAAACLSLFGCAGRPAGSSSFPASSSAAMAASSQASSAQQKIAVITYLPTNDGMYIKPEEIKVASGKDVLKNALDGMISLDRQQKHPLLPQGLVVKDVHEENNITVVNFSKELKNLNGGSTTEDLFIGMTVDTLTNFPNVKKVQFQIEGTPVKKLTGHYDLSQPLERNTEIIQK